MPKPFVSRPLTRALPPLVLPNRVLHRLLLAGALLLLPARALAAPPAQEGTLDPAVLEAIQRSAAIVAAASGGASSAAPVALTVDEPVEEPVDEPTDEPVDEPAATIDDVVIGPETEFEAGGISLMLPDTWEASEDEYSGLPSIRDEATNFRVELMDAGGDFPGLIIFPIIEGNAELFIESFGEGATLSGISRLITEDGLPVLRIGYENGENPDGDIVSGAIYFVATGASAYGLMAGSNAELWPAYVDAMDAMVQSMLVDEANVTLQQAGADGAVADDALGRFSVTVPATWFYSSVDDAEMGLVIADPELLVVGAMLASANDASEEEVQELTALMAGEGDPAQLEELLSGILSTLDMGDSQDITLNEEATATFPGGGSSVGTIRLVADLALEDGPSLPITMYVTIFPSQVTATVFFGDATAVANVEETVLAMVETIVPSE